MQVRGHACEPGHVVLRHHLDHHRFGRRCVEGVRADKEQAHDQSREMGDDRNGKSRANVSLQSDHTRCKSISPRRTGTIYHPRRLLFRIFVVSRLHAKSPSCRTCSALRSSGSKSAYSEEAGSFFTQPIAKPCHFQSQPAWPPVSSPATPAAPGKAPAMAVFRKPSRARSSPQTINL